MNIPISYQLAGTDWKVVWDNTKLNNQGDYGTCSHSESMITLSTTIGLKNLSEGKMEQTFYHELVHSILDSIHERELSDNEKFVDNFANMLHQFIKSAKYE
jgi:hypothetical protein